MNDNRQDRPTITPDGRKAFKKKRITRMSLPLPCVLPSNEDTEAETIKLPVAMAKRLVDGPRPLAASVPPLPSATHEDDEAIRESLAAQQTHLLPVPPQMSSTFSRPTEPHQLPHSPADQQSSHYNQQQPILPSLAPMLSLTVGRWKLSHILLMVVILAPFIIGGGVLEAAQLSQSQNGLYQINALTGTIQWQQSQLTPLQVVYADALGSFLTINPGRGLHQLAALNPQGVTLWKTAQSQHTFSLFPQASPAGTILLALSGDIAVHHPLSVNTATYLHPLKLSLLERQSGHMLWQQTVVGSQQQEGAEILSVDSTNVYVAVMQTQLSTGPVKQGVQLLAINAHTGQVAWHLTDTTQANSFPQDAGHLLLQQHLAIWQSAGIVTAINTAQGKVLWRKFIQETNPQMLVGEESQMAIAAGDVLIERHDAFHALDLLTGNVRWETFNPGFNTTNGMTVASITTYGNTIFLYDNQAIEAIDATTRHIIWSQQQLDAIHNLNISVDGTLVYVNTTDSIEGSSPAQALAALDSKNGAVRWTFQPLDQMTFLPLQPSGIAYNRQVLLTAFCPSLPSAPCTQQYLYALNPSTGAVIWKYLGNSISDVRLSDDGRTVLFQRTSSTWLDITDHFKNS